MPHVYASGGEHPRGHYRDPAVSWRAGKRRDGLSQTEVAERMGTAQSAVARLEGGRSLPSLRTLERHASATGSRAVVKLEAQQ